ncbi:APC family permease [Streptomyces sp. IBSBF 2435]|uniref:APC family permease n=1 Tax=Streptomyces sp. IBSBF 2435 TaxID=2903531 RepID=UPI002FDC1EED
MNDAHSETGAAGPGVPSPAEALPGLDEDQLHVLGEVGRAWALVSGGPAGQRHALPVDPDLGAFPPSEAIGPDRFGRMVSVAPLGPGTSPADEGPAAGASRLAQRLRHAVIGAPLKSTAVTRERMRKLVALPVLSADALSSVAYGPEAMLAVLVLAGTAGLDYTTPVAAAIAFLMLAVGVSYRQTIRAYPHGGGSYIVASDNLGRVTGLVAAAGLMTDYILTVAVSIASGVAAITSALPSVSGYTVPMGAGVIALLLVGNLRGLRQAGALFAAPTYAFTVAVFALIAVGLHDAAGRDFHATATPHLNATEGVGILLVMRAFASGSTAMTGIEAISNAVPAFQPTEWRNARTTLTWMIGLLITMFAGTTAIAVLDGVVPRSDETVLSQLAHRSFGSGPMYVFTQAATAAVLLLAANTAYNDFPRVLFLLARDGHAPRAFLRLGDRLAFSNGITLLSVAAALVFVAFSGDTASLIPLYAVGVFLAFTLSQAGMVRHWWRLRDRHWRKSLFFNATGCLLSALVFITAGITKFTEGAWVAIVAVGVFLMVTMSIHRHYTAVRAALRLHPQSIEIPMSHDGRRYEPRPPEPPEEEAGREEAGREGPGRDGAGEADARGTVGEDEESPEEIRHLSIVPISTLDLAGMRALAYAASLRQPVMALHLSPSEAEADRFQRYWHVWGDHLPLEVLVSPYRATVAPLVNYIEALHEQQPRLTLTIIVPEIVTRRRRHRFLHSRTANRLQRALRPLPKVVVTTVAYHV